MTCPCCFSSATGSGLALGAAGRAVPTTLQRALGALCLPHRSGRWATTVCPRPRADSSSGFQASLRALTSSSEPSMGVISRKLPWPCHAQDERVSNSCSWSTSSTGLGVHRDEALSYLLGILGVQCSA